jgi:hypothetical protein
VLIERRATQRTKPNSLPQLITAQSTGTAGYGTVRPVVWEDGGGDPASYPINLTLVSNPDWGSLRPLSSKGIKYSVL